MIVEIKKIIYQLFQYRRSTAESTKIFTELKHNSGLCPKFQAKVDDALGAFEKYRRITYDIQGPRDAGSDVIMRQTIDDTSYFICFQIKSEDDLRDRNYLKTLKSQWFDTEQTYRESLIDYYILLCCDSTNRSNKEKIRCVETEFKMQPRVNVIEPEYAISLLKLSLMQIDAIIKTQVGSDDIVYRNALPTVRDLTPTEYSVLLYMLWLNLYQGDKAVSVEDFLNSAFVQEIYATTFDYKRDWFFADDDSVFHLLERDMGARIRDDLEYLVDTEIYQDASGNFYINIKEYQPIIILMMDGNERYGYESDDLLFYMVNLFAPMKGYEAKEAEI